MTADERWQARLGELARGGVDVAELLKQLSLELAAAGVPMRHVSEALALARRALTLSAAIDELRNKAAPMAPREGH